MRLPSTYTDHRVCIIGLGYVGLTLAVAMAEVGFDVYGVERDPHIVDVVSTGHAHFVETGLDPRLAVQITSAKLRVSQSWPEPGTCDIFIITVGTPLQEGHKTNLDAIRSVAALVGETMCDGAMVVLRSTVRIGVSRDVVKPILDRAGTRYDLAFCPERTLEGKAMLELRTLPQIIGGFDEESAYRASHMFNFLTPTTVRVSNLETAEMIKLINNTQRDLMFAFANEVADVCDTVGVSVTEVIGAGNMGYARASMPLPGPVGGPCLEKDPYILAESVALRGGRSRLALLGRQLNEELPGLAIEHVAQALGTRAITRISIVGLAFKGRPETSDLRGSLVIPLIAGLKQRFPQAQISGFDPAVGEGDTASLDIGYFPTIAEAFRDADAVIFQNNNERFGKLDLTTLSRELRPDAVIYDLWNQFDAAILSLRPDVTYFGFGTKVLAAR